MISVLIKSGEIALKGKNRFEFENKLKQNIKLSCRRQDLKLISVKREKQTMLANFEDEEDKEKIISALKKVFGIQLFSFVEELPKDVDSILIKARSLLEEMKENGLKEVGFKTKRADKGFPLKSPELNAKMGEIVSELGMKVNYKCDEKIFVEILFRKCFIHTKRIKGLGGLPVGTSGKVLVLLSGGIDSPVAANLIMKRGLTCDFLHFHTFAKNETVLNTKMKELVDVLNDYQFKSKLFLIPYSYFDFAVQNAVPRRYQLVFFKHFIFKMAEKIAIERGYDAIVSGDSLCQVASQTIENIKATSLGISLPIFRPLLTYDKEEIISIARDIKTYELSIQEYKDCCSLVSENPLTKTNLDKFRGIVEDSNLDGILDENMKVLEEF